MRIPFLLALLAAATAPTAPVLPLGSPPLCEASAAVPAPWDRSRLLIADNELEGELFSFRLEDGKLSGQRSLALGKEPLPHDVEALALLDGELLVIGSHSRNKSCARKPKRHRISRFSATPAGGLQRTGLLESGKGFDEKVGSQAACLAGLFVAPPPALAAEACVALVSAERTALAGGACQTFNVEGAAVTGEPERLWLGLRSPLAGGHALLLRLVPGLTELRFDAVALLPLRGSGVRELVVDGATLRVVAGPQSDGAGPGDLWAAPLAGLLPGATLVPVRGASLPPAAEALVPAGELGVIVTDGAKGRRPESCDVPSGQLTVPLAVP